MKFNFTEGTKEMLTHIWNGGRFVVGSVVLVVFAFLLAVVVIFGALAVFGMASGVAIDKGFDEADKFIKDFKDVFKGECDDDY